MQRKWDRHISTECAVLCNAEIGHIIIDAVTCVPFRFHICPLWFYKFAHISIFTFPNDTQVIWSMDSSIASSLLLSYYMEEPGVREVEQDRLHLYFLSCLSISTMFQSSHSFSWVAHFPYRRMTSGANVYLPVHNRESTIGLAFPNSTIENRRGIN